MTKTVAHEIEVKRRDVISVSEAADESCLDERVERHLAERGLSLGARHSVVEHQHAHRVAGGIAHSAQMPLANRRAGSIEHVDADLRNFLRAGHRQSDGTQTCAECAPQRGRQRGHP